MRFSDTNPTLWITSSDEDTEKTNKGFVFEEREKERKRESERVTTKRKRETE